ncbi:hypothetical protein ABF174_002466 [Flavobacterium psychrophilum]
MSTFLERLEVEEQELETKTHALETFIDSNPVFETVSKFQRVLLITQCSSMQMYLFTLKERIADLQATV